MKTKHTQGEWNTVNQPDENGQESNHFAVTNGDTVIHVSGEDDPSNEANAKLIAAAPEMLEALEMVKHVLEVQGKTDWIAYTDAINAINKATK